ncbi:MaoC family dehydratase [Streptomyces sp. NBC_00306]|uniref:MaoC family dehydratase n=1 Tax=Streptomyces sp. NBC_00306 TaxID=2975708 RepID=UPI002E2AAA1D|nr:MaoC/PaaZ C-terminal domain-containing protein [Streptomyces sp. NBC_00306]
MPLALTLARGALTSPLKRGVHADAELPATRIGGPVRIDPARLAAYARICGFPGDGPLPLPYPHVLGFPLAMRLMAARRFPLPLLGLVHTRIEITGHRPLTPEDTPVLTVHAEALTPHRRGTEVTVVTRAHRDGDLVWESRSGYLARHRTSYDTDRPAPETRHRTAHDTDHRPDEPLPAVGTWQLPADLGRRYGAASGDRNPIHLHPLTARAFGFPRAIAHGMWTFARCLAESASPQLTAASAEFRAPVLLPASVTYAAEPAGSGTAFQLRSGDRIHLSGRTSAHPS